MKFTGERYEPSEKGEIEIEHLHRYAAVLEISKGKNVLDLACGEGYGAAILSEVAERVVGVDISQEVILAASKKYESRANLSFAALNAIATGLPSEHFDLVVSFETIEHLAEQEQLLKEIRRLLKPSGILVMSSPNRPVYGARRQEPNKFHVKELDFFELDVLLRAEFSHVEYYGQRMHLGSLVQPLVEKAESFRAYSGSANEVRLSSTELEKPVYFIALCSNSEPGPVLPSSIYSPEGVDLVERLVGFGRWARQQDAQLEQKRTTIVQLREQLAIHVADKEALSKRLEEQKFHFDRKVMELSRLQEILKTELIRSEAQLSLLRDILVEGMDKSESL